MHRKRYCEINFLFHFAWLKRSCGIWGGTLIRQFWYKPGTPFFYLTELVRSLVPADGSTLLKVHARSSDCCHCDGSRGLGIFKKGFFTIKTCYLLKKHRFRPKTHLFIMVKKRLKNFLFPPTRIFPVFAIHDAELFEVLQRATSIGWSKTF